MLRFVYIHGFNSAAECRSCKALREILQAPLLCPGYDYSRTFQECRDFLERTLQDILGPGDRLHILGSSLGGFYALQMRLAGIEAVTVWNPVIFPALQLARFVGGNVHFYGGGKWHFGRESLNSYAAAPDPRQWLNFYALDAWADERPARPRRKIYLGIHDDLLDPGLAESFWRGHADIESIGEGHSIADYSHAAGHLKKFCQ